MTETVREETGYVKWGRVEQIAKIDSMLKVLTITENKPSVRIKLSFDGSERLYGLELAKDLIKRGKAELVK
jgi:hypothetical protein